MKGSKVQLFFLVEVILVLSLAKSCEGSSRQFQIGQSIETRCGERDFASKDRSVCGFPPKQKMFTGFAMWIFKMPPILGSIGRDSGGSRWSLPHISQ